MLRQIQTPSESPPIGQHAGEFFSNIQDKTETIVHTHIHHISIHIFIYTYEKQVSNHDHCHEALGTFKKLNLRSYRIVWGIEITGKRWKTSEIIAEILSNFTKEKW